jgi:hypothetical protein
MNNLGRPLPGIRFDVPPAALDDPLPRMDVAVLVGFAASGPLDWPVLVESAAEFRTTFGDDLPLAWDSQRDEMSHSLLGQAVAQFFANGGRRCWVIRVAGESASYNYFPVPGLLVARYDSDGHLHSLAPAFARSASRGRYADGWQLRAAISQRSLLLDNPWGGEQWLQLAAGNLPQVGDVLRLADAGAGVVVMAAVVDIEPQRRRCRIRQRIAFMGDALPPVDINGRGWVYGKVRVASAARGLLPAFGHSHPFTQRCKARLLARVDQPGWRTLQLGLPADKAPAIGAWVRFQAQGQQWWLQVAALMQGEQTLQVSGPIWRHLPMEQALLTLKARQAVISAEVLTLSLRVEQGASAATREGLGLAAGHAAAFNALPSDDDYFRRVAGSDEMPHFVLAGCEQANTVFLPLSLDAGYSPALGALPQSASRLMRDGLAQFDASLFLDPALAGVSTELLQTEADRLRYTGPAPRPLRGLHAALGWHNSAVIEEATLIATPDAVHRPWRASTPPPLLAPHVESRLPHPEWWHHTPCSPSVTVALAEAPPTDGFLFCGLRLLPLPTLQAAPVDGLGTIRLRWSHPEQQDQPDLAPWFELQEANRADFSDARVVYQGTARELTLYGRPPGDYAYRLRVESGRNGSHWTTPLVLRVGAVPEAELISEADYDDDALRQVQVALLRLAAARGDVFAVLGLPRFYRARQAQQHALLLQTFGDGFDPRALGGLESATLAFGALYHPWVVNTEAGQIRATPPDGLALGQLANRAWQRGTWVAPANLALQQLQALDQALSDADWQTLLQAQVNLIRQTPRGFLCLSADTLALEDDLRSINVRRLLSLLRRVAVLRGQLYVFEPLSEVFRRSVQRGFEATLSELFRRGAFAGAFASEAFRVEVGIPPNSAHDLDNGRFIVNLKVAPSRPLAFLTIRLLQIGERLQLREGA